VVRPVRDVEDYSSVVGRQDLPNAPGHVGRPELQVAAVFILPVTIQIDQNVQPSIQRKRAMAAEVCVDPKLAATRDLMEPTPVEVRVGNEILDPCQLLQKLQEWRGIELIQQKGGEDTDLPFALRLKFPLVIVLVFLPDGALRAGKLRQDTVQGLFGKQPIEDTVGKWLGGRISCSVRAGNIEELLAIQVKLHVAPPADKGSTARIRLRWGSLHGQATNLYLKEIVLCVQFPWGNLVRGEPPHLGGSGERVTVRFDPDVGGPKELTEQRLDA